MLACFQTRFLTVSRYVIMTTGSAMFLTIFSKQKGWKAMFFMLMEKDNKVCFANHFKCEYFWLDFIAMGSVSFVFG